MGPLQPIHRPPSSRPVLLVVALLLLLRLLSLGLYPLSDATEARYAEIARKMVELNDWVTPWYDYGVPFWAKPPLSTWITAASIKLFGVNEFAVRLPHFLAGLAVIGLMAGWLRRRSEREALLAAALLSSCVLFLVSAGAVMTDMAMTLGIVMAMRGFWLGLHGNDADRRREPWLLFCGLALGLLAKGPVALVLCGTPIVLWTIVTGNLRLAWHGLPWLRGVLLVSALSVPWYLLAEQHTPGFLNYFLVGEHWKRFTVSGWTGDRYGTAHAVPPGMIWIYALAACFPWTLLLPLLALGQRGAPALPAATDAQRDWSRFLWVWALTPCLFFTASRNIIWTYFLPGIPAAAALAAAWLARRPNPVRTDRLMIGGMLFIALAFAATLGVMQVRAGFKSAKLVINALQVRHIEPGTLMFVGHGIYTPAFYSHGTAQQVAATADLENILVGSAPAPRPPRFVALYGTQWAELAPRVQDRLQPEGRYGNYDLYSVRP